MFFYSDFKRTINVPTAKLSFCPHHLSHAYSVIPFSNKDEPHLSLVLDGFGDVFSTSAYLVENQKFPYLKVFIIQIRLVYFIRQLQNI